jgi:hypothetical protein
MKKEQFIQHEAEILPLLLLLLFFFFFSFSLPMG